MRPASKTKALSVLVGCVALVAVISLRVSDEPAPAIPPTLTPATSVPALPVQRGVVPLEPEPVAAPAQPKAHAATSIARERTPGGNGDGDWASGQPQRLMASRLCGDFGISC